jgi:hypothetical protein
VRGVAVVVEHAVTLRGHDHLHIVLVMRGARDLVGRGPAGQALPLQQAGQLGMGCVIVERASGERCLLVCFVRSS